MNDPRQIAQRIVGTLDWQGEGLVLESVRVMAGRLRPELFDIFQWPFAEIVAESPPQITEGILLHPPAKPAIHPRYPAVHPRGT
jgi:hypothetical protein